MQAHLNAEQWQFFAQSYVELGLALVLAAESGPEGTQRELAAIANAAQACRHLFAHTALVQSVLDATLAPDAPFSLTERLRSFAHMLETTEPMERAELRAETLQAAVQRCSTLADLLTQHTTPDVATHFKQFLLYVCGQVAFAAYEAASIQTDVIAISREEMILLGEFARALQMDG